MQSVSSSKIAMPPNTSEVSTGSALTRMRNTTDVRSDCRLPNHIDSARYAMNANSAMPGSATGMPPHTMPLRNDAYGLISATWQPELPLMSGAPPGRIERRTSYEAASGTAPHVSPTGADSPAAARSAGAAGPTGVAAESASG